MIFGQICARNLSLRGVKRHYTRSVFFKQKIHAIFTSGVKSEVECHCETLRTIVSEVVAIHTTKSCGVCHFKKC